MELRGSFTLKDGGRVSFIYFGISGFVVESLRGEVVKRGYGISYRLVFEKF